MKVLLISDNSCTDETGETISKKLLELFTEEKDEYTHFKLKHEDMNHCIGCFNCWLKTPGMCIFNDVGREVTKSYIQNEVVIFVSPIKYGCYSVVIRRAMDRLLPNVLPFFRKFHNEVHHAPRYPKYPQVVVFGYGEEISDFEIDTFKSLSDANAVNFMTDSARTYVCGRADVDKSINSLKLYLHDLEGVRV